MGTSARIRPFQPLYRITLGFTVLGLLAAIFMIARPVTVMQSLFTVGGIRTLQHSESMAAGFSRYVFLAGIGLLVVMTLKTFFLWLWFRKHKISGLILYVFLNLCLAVLSQYAAINYYGFFYAFVAPPAAGILLHLLTLQPARKEKSEAL